MHIKPSLTKLWLFPSKIKKKYDQIDIFIKKLKSNVKPGPGISILATPAPAKYSTPVGL